VIGVTSLRLGSAPCRPRHPIEQFLAVKDELIARAGYEPRAAPWLGSTPSPGGRLLVSGLSP